jgi:hypothetical protein
MKISVFKDENEIFYDDIYIEHSINKLISFAYITVKETLDININDKLFIMINDVNPYIILKITNIEILKNNNDYVTNITCKSIENELDRFYTTETKQFNPNSKISNILTAYNFNINGDDFNLNYEDYITIPIGVKLIDYISKFIYQHGYIFNSKDKYILNIEKIAKNNDNIELNYYDSIKYSRSENYDNISILSESNLSISKKWEWLEVNNSKSAYITNIYQNINSNLNKLVEVEKDRIHRKMDILEITTKEELVIYPNTIITLNNLPDFINFKTYYVVSVVYNIDSIELVLYGVGK